jgi:protein-S-isoprenylcysteine O-methyltransferase Ste14
MDYIYLSLLWASFGLGHSVFLNKKIMSQLQDFFRLNPEGYRLVYSVFSIIHFGLVFYFQTTIPKTILFTPPLFISIAGYFGLIASIICLILILKRYSSAFDFLGLNAIFKKNDQSNSGNDSEKQLVKTGWNAYVRHPIYTATLAAFWFAWLTDPTIAWLIFCLVNTAYVIFAIPIEERKLVEEFGEDYRIYKKEVPALVPRPFSFKG